MLNILFGPSCCGKTTLIKNLIEKYNVGYVSCYTTRTKRDDDDIGRYSISALEFELLRKDNKFFLINDNFKFKYGTPWDEINEAVKSHSPYVVDFLIKDIHSFNLISCNRIIVVPETKHQLEQQVKSANRLDRLSEIMADYENNYSSEKINKYINEGCKLFTNLQGAYEQNAININKLILA